MDPLTITAASGMRSRLESLEMLANNLANAATAGYKLDRESYSLYFSQAALAPGDGTPVATQPVIEGQWTDYTQGTLTPTSNPMDLALSGKGFFAVNGPKGALYTRNGSMRQAKDNTLTTSEGYALRAVGGKTIQLQSDAPIEVTPQGEVRQSGQLLGQLEIVNFTQTGALAKWGKNYFQASDPGILPTPAADAVVHQGQLEASNVSAPESAVRLINMMRQFEMLQKAVSISSEMGRKAIDEVARVNG